MGEGGEYCYLLSVIFATTMCGRGGGIHNTENSLEKQNMNGLEQIDLRDFYF